MADLIEREKAINIIPCIRKCKGDYYEKYYTEGFNACVIESVGRLTNLPPADTERHAHWIDINEVSAKCSNCENFILRCDTNNYCPNCGCKMDEVTE